MARHSYPKTIKKPGARPSFKGRVKPRSSKPRKR